MHKTQDRTLLETRTTERYETVSSILGSSLLSKSADFLYVDMYTHHRGGVPLTRILSGKESII